MKSQDTISEKVGVTLGDCRKTKHIRWDEARELLKPSAGTEEVFANLDQIIQRSKTQKVFVAEYDYGDLIVDCGRFVPPCSSRDCEGCAGLRQSAEYTCIPLTFLVARNVEIFIDYKNSDERTAPLRVMKEGELFGVFEVLDLLLNNEVVEPIWSVAAGARSIHIIAPLGNRSLPQWIRTRVGRQVTWTKKSPHWLLVKEASEPKKWMTKLVILPREVIQKIRQTDRFFEFLLETGWVQSRSLRNSMIDDANLRGIVGAEISNEPAPLGELYHYATLRHLLSLSRGSLPCFVSSKTLSDPAGPFDTFCSLLAEALRDNTDFNYEPLVMQPSHVAAGARAYYSMRCPSMPGPNPQGVNTYATVVSAFRNVLDRIKVEPWPALASNTKFFVKDCDFRKYPGIEKADNLNAEHFFETPNANSEIYFDAPFFVAGVELSVVGTNSANLPVRTMAQVAR